MLKVFSFLFLFPITLLANSITTIYDCDNQGRFYIKIVGNFSSNDVSAYWAGQPNSYVWDLIAKGNDVRYFRDKLIINDGNWILESPKENGSGYSGLVRSNNNDVSFFCKVTFE